MLFNKPNKKMCLKKIGVFVKLSTVSNLRVSFLSIYLEIVDQFQ